MYVEQSHQVLIVVSCVLIVVQNRTSVAQKSVPCSISKFGNCDVNAQVRSYFQFYVHCISKATIIRTECGMLVSCRCLVHVHKRPFVICAVLHLCMVTVYCLQCIPFSIALCVLQVTTKMFLYEFVLDEMFLCTNILTSLTLLVI